MTTAASRHAELVLDGGIVMIGEGVIRVEAEDVTKGGRIGLYVAVDDVDVVHDRAAAAGAEVSDVIEQPYGSREFMASDVEGVVWYFGTYRP